MRNVITWLIACLLVCVCFLGIHHIFNMPGWYLDNILLIRCTLIGVMGGLLYCLRSVYLNKCVRKQWDKEWEVWYYLRPIASGISGFISYIFLKAGLLVLEADPKPDAIAFGYLAVAFIAGYNVDNFMKKLEAVAASVWGISKSRAADEIKTNNNGKDTPER